MLNKLTRLQKKINVYMLFATFFVSETDELLFLGREAL